MDRTTEASEGLANYTGHLLGLSFFVISSTLVLCGVGQSRGENGTGSTASSYILINASAEQGNTLFNRVLLPSTVTKNNTQTMKVTVTINFG